MRTRRIVTTAETGTPEKGLDIIPVTIHLARLAMQTTRVAMTATQAVIQTIRTSQMVALAE